MNSSNYGGFNLRAHSYAQKTAMTEVFIRSSYSKNEFNKRENELIGAWENDLHPLKVQRVVNVNHK